MVRLLGGGRDMATDDFTDEEYFKEQEELRRSFEGCGWLSVPMPTDRYSIAVSYDVDFYPLDDRYSVAVLQDDDIVHPLAQFYCDLYGMSGMDGATILLNHPTAEGQSHYRCVSRYELLEADVTRQESFIYLGKFWQPESGYVSAKAQFQDTIEAFCVDIDRKPGVHLMGGQLALDLAALFSSYPEVRPQYITLTGGGVQLWYMFGKAVNLYSSKVPRRKKYTELYYSLYEWWDEHLYKNRGDVDMSCASLNHAFRAPGSPSKHGFGTQLMRDGERMFEPTDCLNLAGFLGVDDFKSWDWKSSIDEGVKEEIAAFKAEREKQPASDRQLGLIDQMHEDGAISDSDYEGAGDFNVVKADEVIKKGLATYQRWKRGAKDEQITIQGGVSVPAKPRHVGLYEYIRDRIPKDTPVGSRYNALVVLAGQAYNCGIPKAQLEHDMREIMMSPLGQKRSSRDGKGITDHDIKSALKSYKPLGALRHRDKQEVLLGWSFAPPAKRNHRTRSEHLEKVHDQRRFSTEMKLVRYLQKNPTATQAQAERELGVTRKTLRKYWPEACRIAQIEDTRTGNHSPSGT